LLMVAMSRHELWGDELQAWNLAKGSLSYHDLIVNTRFEGHPPVWFTMLWAVSKYTHDFAWVQALQVLICCAAVFLLLFYSPLSLRTRLLLPFGYYFLFEYAVLSRNYMIAVLLVFCLCLVLRKAAGRKLLLYYYALLFLLTCTHMLILPLAAGLHLYFLWQLKEHGQKTVMLLLHAGLGLLVACPALYFIFPPSDSQINIGFWTSRWSAHQLTGFIQAPLQAFLPVPAWWEHQWWNSEFLVEAKKNIGLLRLLNWPVSIAMIASGFFALMGNRKALLVFCIAFAGLLLIAISFFPLGSARYAGFLFIAFIAAWWLFCAEAAPPRGRRWLVDALLLVQLAAGMFSLVKDIRQPFSNLYKINELLGEVPTGQAAICDYWALNAVSAFTDRPFYCMDLQKPVSFILWGSDLASMQKEPHRYCTGVERFFKKQQLQSVYLVSTGSPESIGRLDSLFFTTYDVRLVDKREGAIEKGSNLYLYHIKER
ncbi:MAG: hypothetical protein JST39_11115, partial [Bacteroidetes bacterium]|nr:hypothetical protein [Bacteroidota bacterium]